MKEYTDKTGRKWFEINYLSNLMRKSCSFRMIGKTFFFSPYRNGNEKCRIIDFEAWGIPNLDGLQDTVTWFLDNYPNVRIEMREKSHL